jgi:Tol biopolymer transport system component
MKLRTWLIIAVILGLLISFLVIWASSPRIAALTPLPGSQDVSQDSPLQITFTQPMQVNSLEERLVIEPDISGQFTYEDQMLTFVPDQPWPGGQVITITLRSGARALGNLGLPVWTQERWSFQVSKMLLAYLWPAGDLADLYALHPLSGEVTRLTESAAVQDFTVSPDGKAIVYTADRLRGGSVLIRLSLDESTPGIVTASETVAMCEMAVCRNPAISPDGRWLAYEHVPEFSNQNQIEVRLLDLASGRSQPVGDPNHSRRDPAWSLTGWLAIYDVIDEAYHAIHSESGATILFRNQIGEPGSWHPDGKRFLASEIFDESSEILVSAASGHLLVYDIRDTSRILDLTKEYYLEDIGGVFAPDGLQIAFTRKYLDPMRWTTGRQVWVMDLDAADGQVLSERQLTNAPLYNHYALAWSPDSQQIAFMRFNLANLADSPELWLMNADGSNPVQLVIGAYAPHWIP